MSTSVDAQTSKSKVKVKTTKAALISVPEVVKTNFQTKYISSTNNSWSKAHGNYVVNFVNADGQKETAEYAAEGNLVKSKTTYSNDKIPENISNSLAAKYSDATITEVSKYELAGVSPYYKLKITQGTNTKEILMSEEGTISE